MTNEPQRINDFGTVLVDADGDFWMGDGYYTDDPRKAKVYHSTEELERATEQMKRRNFKWVDLDCLVNYGNGWVIE